MYKREDPLLGTPVERVENGERHPQSMSQDEGLLARLGYKQGSSCFLPSDMSRINSTISQS